jgi:N-acetylmuramoyl-L-alanine amidase
MDERTDFARCLWGEARGEGYCGMMAVACVIWNRHLRWNKTVEEVVTGPNQFTSMAGAGPQPAENDPQYMQAVSIVSGFYTGFVEDITNGACYYANLKTATSGWFFDTIVADKVNHAMVAIIKEHTFFK